MSLNAEHISPELILFALLNYIAYAILCLRLQTCRKISMLVFASISMRFVVSPELKGMKLNMI